MRISTVLISIIFAASLFTSCGTGDDPEAVISIVDEKNRPIPGATVEIFSRPTNLFREDIKFTDEDGKTYHKFVFEGTLDVKARIEKFSIYHDLSGEGEINLKRDETYNTTITLTEPAIIEED